MNNEIENIISHIQPEEDSEKMLNYIEELEQQNKELGENEQHYKKVYLEELALKSKVEQQKAELINLLKSLWNICYIPEKYMEKGNYIEQKLTEYMEHLT